jgi:hypothetical protein
MNPRVLAIDAAGWYFSRIDPCASNESNIHNFLRTPLVALTVKAIQSSTLDPTVPDTAAVGVKDPVSEIVEGNEEKKSASGGGGLWREYLQMEDAAAIASNNSQQRWLQEGYRSLSRRNKARMEAFLAGCSLAVPGPGEGPAKSRPSTNTLAEEETGVMVSLQDGLSGFGINGRTIKSLAASPKKKPPSLTEKMGRSMVGQVSDPTKVKHPQIDESDLVVRLELYIRSVHRAKNVGEECVIAMEPPKAIRARSRYITDSFVATAAYVRNITPVLTRLLHCLTMELLAVECVAEEITKVMQRVASEYEHATSFASLAFLSTPEVNADSVLTPLILKYLKYLQADFERLVRECELERMLVRAMDPELRKMFKTVEFRSIGHLLEVCHQFRVKLQSIELPPNVCAIAENVNTLCNSPEAVRQALRDLRREIITVNGHVLPPVTSRKELISLLTQTLNSRTLTSLPPKQQRNNRKTKKTDIHRPKIAAPRRSRNAAVPVIESSDGDSSPEKQRKLPPGCMPEISDISEQESSMTSDYESSSAVDSSPEKKPAVNGGHRRRRSKFHLSTIDVLTRRLLIAGSRTGNGGDAYFFV